MYVGGWRRCVDAVNSDKVNLWSLTRLLQKVGCEGLCFYYYKKPGTRLANGLVHIRLNTDLGDFLDYALEYREIEMFVTHPTKKQFKNMLLLEMYHSLRAMWPKATLEEVTDE